MILFISLILSWGNIAFEWFIQNYLELIATVTGLIYIYYGIKGDKRLWIYGFISSFIYVYVFLSAGIYADMGLSLYYVGVSIYGWVHWTYYGTSNKVELPITRTKPGEAFILLLVTGLIYLLIVYILSNYTDSNITHWDAFTTSASITATWMLARKMLEQWLIWVVVDAVSLGLYIYKGLYFTSFLFLVYTVMAIIGYIQWKRQLEKQIKSSY